MQFYFPALMFLALRGTRLHAVRSRTIPEWGFWYNFS